MNKRTLLALLAGLSGAIAGLALADVPQTVTIDKLSFKPNVITVKPGEHVVFKNQDNLPHNVVIPDMK